MSDDLNARLEEYLENCKIPLSRDDWAGFYRELDERQLSFLFMERLKRMRKWFEWLSKGKLDDNRVYDSLILALRLLYDARHWRDFLKKGDARFDKVMKEFELLRSKRKRDLKPKESNVKKNWLEPMPVYSDTEPYGYVQATAQRRKKIESFLSSIKAKPELPSAKKQRGRPNNLYGFKINCRVLNQWLGKWCDPRPEQKYDLVLREARILATAVAEAKRPVSGDRLARLRLILRTHARLVAKQVGVDSDFDFLRSAAACTEMVKRLRESDPEPRSLLQERVSHALSLVASGQSAELPS